MIKHLRLFKQHPPLVYPIQMLRELACHLLSLQSLQSSVHCMSISECLHLCYYPNSLKLNVPVCRKFSVRVLPSAWRRESTWHGRQKPPVLVPKNRQGSWENLRAGSYLLGSYSALTVISGVSPISKPPCLPSVYPVSLWMNECSLYCHWIRQ